MPFYKTVVASDSVVILDPSSTTPGAGWVSSTVSDAITYARTNGRPIFLKPGIYNSSNIDILSTNGSGKSIRIYAMPGSVTINFNGGTHCVNIKDVNEVQFDGVGFDFQNQALSAYAGGFFPTAGYFAINNSQFFSINDCTFKNGIKNTAEKNLYNFNSYKGLLFITNGAVGEVKGCKFSNGDAAIRVQRARLTATSNTIKDMETNGIMVQDLALGGNHSLFENNFIQNIAAPFGNGQTGNGIQVYRANNVVCRNNIILACKYSAIRYNGSSFGIISGNTIWDSKETALWAEAPGTGDFSYGSIITDNSINSCGSGIVVSNSGQTYGGYTEGTSGLSIVRGNCITNMAKNPIPSVPGPNGPIAAYVTVGIGALVEQDAVIQSNIFENCPGGAIKLGTAVAARDLICDGNLVRNSPFGIAFSSDPAASNILITNNAMRNTSTTALCSVPSNVFVSPPTATYNANLLSQFAQNATILIADNRSL